MLIYYFRYAVTSGIQLLPVYCANCFWYSSLTTEHVLFLKNDRDGIAGALAFYSNTLPTERKTISTNTVGGDWL
jgi:hypothetical protein